MRLINVESLRLEEFFDGDAPPYAILSHTWGDEEVTFQDFQVEEVRQEKKGFAKIHRTCLRSKADGLQYAWVDTCCIDKRSSSELGKAINSMFEWYEDATVCYAYLEDVSGDCPEIDDENIMHPRQLHYVEMFEESRWFTRGWTLQELIAPKQVFFFGQSWNLIGSRAELVSRVSGITGIRSDVLDHSKPLADLSVAARLSWMALRQTTRKEDAAYSLLGILDVNMPLLYGEGENAFLRLQTEIIKQSKDQSIFAWDFAPPMMPRELLLAPSPQCFKNAGRIRRGRYTFDENAFRLSNKGLEITLPLIRRRLQEDPSEPFVTLGILDCMFEGSNEMLALVLSQHPFGVSGGTSSQEHYVSGYECVSAGGPTFSRLYVLHPRDADDAQPTPVTISRDLTTLAYIQAVGMNYAHPCSFPVRFTGQRSEKLLALRDVYPRACWREVSKTMELQVDRVPHGAIVLDVNNEVSVLVCFGFDASSAGVIRERIFGICVIDPLCPIRPHLERTIRKSEGGSETAALRLRHRQSLTVRLVDRVLTISVETVETLANNLSQPSKAPALGNAARPPSRVLPSPVLRASRLKRCSHCVEVLQPRHTSEPQKAILSRRKDQSGSSRTTGCVASRESDVHRPLQQGPVGRISPVSKQPKSAESDVDSFDLFSNAAPSFRPVSATDEGYYSLEKNSGSASATGVVPVLETDSDADSIATDNSTHRFELETRQSLEDHFADGLLGDLSVKDEDQRQRLFACAADFEGLLRTFAIMISCHADSSAKRRATTFVRHRRRQISRCLEKELSQTKAKEESDAMDFREKIDSWSISHDDPDDGIQDEREPEEPDLESVGASENKPDGGHSEIYAAREFIFGSGEYQWLVNRLRIAMHTSSVSSSPPGVWHTLCKILSTDRPDRSALTRLLLDVEWDPRAFMRTQYPTPDRKVALKDVITYFGPPERPCARTCGDFVAYAWPTEGLTVLNLVDSAMRDAKGAASLFRKDLEVTVQLENSMVSFDVKGYAHGLMEIAETITWLGAACRTAPELSEPGSCCPIVHQTDSGPPALTATYLVERFSHENSLRSHGQCWTHFIRNPVICQGYPTMLRDNDEPGLELPIELMISLGCTFYAARFGSTFVLKGFSSMFVPVKKLNASIVWHFLVDEAGARMPYTQAIPHSNIVDDIDLHDPATRHFVGWTEYCDIVAGTPAAAYHDLGLSTSDDASSGIIAEPAATITSGKFVTLGIKIMKGVKDTPVHLQSGPYEMQLDCATRWPVIFSDTTTRQHWFLDGATAILHLCHAWLSPSLVHYAPKGIMEQLSYSPSVRGPAASYETLTYPKNRDIGLLSSKESKSGFWTFEDLARRLFQTLELMRDNTAANERAHTVDLQGRTMRLTGMELVDVVRGETLLKPRMVQLGPGARSWLSWSQKEHSINILGSALGALIIPRVPTCWPQTACFLQRTVPVAHDYLFVPLSTLSETGNHRRRADNTHVQLAEGYYWVDPASNFTRCDCGSKPSCRCALLVSKLHRDPRNKTASNGRSGNVFEWYPEGAIVMGSVTEVLVRADSTQVANRTSPENRSLPVDSAYASSRQSTGSSSSGGRRSFWDRRRNG